MGQINNTNRGADQASRSVRRFLDTRPVGGKTIPGSVSSALFRSLMNIVADVSGGNDLPIPQKEELARVIVKQGGMATFELYINALLGSALSNSYCWSEILDKSMIPANKSMKDVVIDHTLSFADEDQAAFAAIKNMNVTAEQAASSVLVLDTPNGVFGSYVRSYFSTFSNLLRSAKKEKELKTPLVLNPNPPATQYDPNRNPFELPKKGGGK